MPAKKTPPAGQQKPPPDWERIEADYRAGVLSLREIAAPYKISHVAIKKRAERDGWTRDLHAKIVAKAEALVNAQAVTTQVTAVTERQVIEANAERIAQVRGEHRADIHRLRCLAMDLMAELEGQTGAKDLLAELGELMRREDDSGQDKLNDLYQKVIGFPSRIDSLRKLSEALKNAIALEREAYGLNANKNPADKPGDVNISF